MSCDTLANFKLALLTPGIPRINLAQGQLSYVIHRDFTEVDKKSWQELVQGQSVFLQAQYLEAFTRTDSASMEFRFASFYTGKKLNGVAVFQLTHFEGSALSSNLKSGNKMLSLIASAFSKQSSPTGRSVNVMICGNAFSTGEHAFYFSPHIKAKHAMAALCRAITTVVKEESSCRKRISAIVIKDFYEAHFSFAEELRKCGFRDFNIDHNMIMPILPEWNNFDDYLSSLNSKFRTKAKSAISRSSALNSQDLDGKYMRLHAEEIQQLYESVSERADFRMGKIEVHQLASLKDTMQNDFIVRGYFLGSKLVGFLTAFHSPGLIDAHVIGIDYSYNKEYSVYARMLYDYIDLAIERKSTRVVFGRTAGEIKSSVGALPVDMKCCIRHPGRFSNVLLNLLFGYVKPSEFPIRQPYRKEIFGYVQSLVPGLSQV